MAKATDHSFSNDQKLTNLWLLNNSCPGPLITAVKGDILELNLQIYLVNQQHYTGMV